MLGRDVVAARAERKWRNGLDSSRGGGEYEGELKKWRVRVNEL